MKNLLVIYRRKNFIIYDSGDGFIVYNTKGSFQKHHTHIGNFHTCKYIIDLSIRQYIPKDIPNYLLVSLKRLSTDQNFQDRIDQIIMKNTTHKKGKSNGKRKD